MRLGIATLLLIFSTWFTAAAQQPFEEGVIVYSVRVGPLEGEAGYTEHAGTYTIKVKGPYVRKELRMNSGYQNIILENRNTGTVYSLRQAGGQHFVIQLQSSDLDERSVPYRGFTEKPEPGTMTIAGQPCLKTIIQYRDGSTSVLYYTTAWSVADSSLFERFPGFRYLPLSFEYRTEEGITMRFSAEKLQAMPVENSVFRVPPGHKIISNAEYKAMRK